MKAWGIAVVIVLILCAGVQATTYTGAGTYSLRAGDSVIVDNTTLTLVIIGEKERKNVGLLSFSLEEREESAFVAQGQTVSQLGVQATVDFIVLSQIDRTTSYARITVGPAQLQEVEAPSPTPASTTTTTLKTTTTTRPHVVIEVGNDEPTPTSPKEPATPFLVGLINWILSLLARLGS